MPTGPSLEMRRNSTEEFEYILETPVDPEDPDSELEPVDITGATLHLTVKRQADTKSLDLDDDEAIVKKTVTDHADPTEGRTVVKIEPADTRGKKPGTYFYDVIWEQADGDAVPIVFGRFELLPNATQELA